MGPKCQQKVTYHPMCQGPITAFYTNSVTYEHKPPGNRCNDHPHSQQRKWRPKVTQHTNGRATTRDIWGHYHCHPRDLQAPVPAPPAVARFVEKLGHLCGLPAARLTTHDDDGVLGHRLHDHLFFRDNWELQPFFLPETRSQRLGNRGSPAEWQRGRGDKVRLRKVMWFL